MNDYEIKKGDWVKYISPRKSMTFTPDGIYRVYDKFWSTYKGEWFLKIRISKNIQVIILESYFEKYIPNKNVDNTPKNDYTKKTKKTKRRIDNMNVKTRLLRSLAKNNRFSAAQARVLFKADNIYARIHELRQDGWPIGSDVVNRKDGTPRMVYSLRPMDNAPMWQKEHLQSLLAA